MTDEIAEKPFTADVSDETIRPNNPHDKAFKRAMERPECARDLISLQYGPLAARMDFSYLKRRPNTYINKAYLEKESDVLFEVMLEGELVLLYILIEHFSKPCRLASFRLLEYTVQIMAQHLRENGGQDLPLILPSIFYTGDKKWNHTTDFRDLIKGPRDIIDQVWANPFPIIKAKELDDDTIKQHKWAGVLSWMMSHVKARDLLRQLDGSPAIIILQEFDAQGGAAREFVIELLRHLLYTSEVNDAELQHYTQQHFTPQVESEIMTLAQRLEERGMQRGLQQGLQQGEVKWKLEGDHNRAVITARKLLRRGGYDLAEIADISGLPEHEVELLDAEE